ncbi:MAG: hypothetical protein KME19_23615 [Microcoleus vaginatus WJT46-NPBG5]|jgi:cell division septum initiation protein DivIVA|nr:hypothetical protein [Microcoleus vaginatus WJT46-NPBG5]
MHLLCKSSLISVSAAVVVLVAGCGNNKVAECNTLIEAINKGHGLVTNFKGNDAAAANKLAEDLDKITKELETVKLKDDKLKGFQTRFSKIYQDLGTAFRTTGKALGTASAAQPTQAGVQQVQKAKTEVEAAGKAAEQAAQKADVLATEINSYCGGKSN